MTTLRFGLVVFFFFPVELLVVTFAEGLFAEELFAEEPFATSCVFTVVFGIVQDVSPDI